MSLISEIRGDPTYKKFKAIFEEVSKRIDVDAAFKEAEVLHEGRISILPRGDSKYSAQKMYDANHLDMSVRSRLVRIRNKNARQMNHLTAAMEAMRKHILTEYSDDMKDYRTESMKKALMDRVMKTAVEFLAQVESLNDTLDVIIKDCDQASHRHHHAVEYLKLMSNVKGRSV